MCILFVDISYIDIMPSGVYYIPIYCNEVSMLFCNSLFDTSWCHQHNQLAATRVRNRCNDKSDYQTECKTSWGYMKIGVI